MNARSAALATALLCAVSAGGRGGGEARAESVSAAARFTGTFRFVGGEAEVRGIEAAIESVVQRMNFLVRGIARRRLRVPNLPSQEIAIRERDGQIVISRPGRPTVAAPADGRPIAWRHPDGDVFEVRQGVEAGVLYQRFHDARSDTINRFHLAPDGRRLIVETTITARRLPAPLRFRTTYERVGSVPPGD